MPIDASIALQGRAPQIADPVNYLVQAQQLQQLQNQNALFPVEMQMKQLQMQRAQAQYNALAHLYDPEGPQASPAPTTAAAPLSAIPQSSAPGVNALAQPVESQSGGTPQSALVAPGGSSSPATMLKRLNALAASGFDTKQLFDQYKFGIEGGQINPGYRLNPATGQLEYHADPTKGFTIDPRTGKVSALDGFADANAQIEGTKTGATTRATNAETPADTGLQMPDGRGGMMVVPGATKAAQLAYLQGGSAPAGPKGPRFVGAELLDQLPPAQAAAIRADLAKSGGKGSINLNTPDGVHVQGDVDLTRAADGYTPPATGSDGKPISPQMKATLLDLAASRDPAKLAAYQQQVLAQIGQLPDGQHKTAVVQRLNAEMQKIAASWQAGDTQPAQGQAPGLATPNDIAMDKEHREADLKFNTDLRSKAHDANMKTLGNLSDSVRNEFEIQNRNKQLLPLLDKIQTGGFSPEGRIQFANALQNSGIVPDSLKGSLSQWIANGDPTAGKVLENQLAAAGVKTMLDTLNKEGNPNRAIFDSLHDAQESVRSGNATLKQVFALQKQLYDMHYQQEQDMAHAIAAPDYNPMTLQADFSRRRNTSLAADKPITGPAPAAATATSTGAAAPASGWSIKRVK